jgi:hypothetical protein
LVPVCKSVHKTWYSRERSSLDGGRSSVRVRETSLPAGHKSFSLKFWSGRGTKLTIIKKAPQDSNISRSVQWRQLSIHLLLRVQQHKSGGNECTLAARQVDSSTRDNGTVRLLHYYLGYLLDPLVLLLLVERVVLLYLDSTIASHGTLLGSWNLI